MTRTKKSLFTSIIALVVCCSMLMSSTFAWFTSSVTSSGNVVAAGNLKVGLLHENAFTKTQPTTLVEVTEDVDKTKPENKLFVDAAGNDMLWEPGAVTWENFTIRNAGDLALVYQFTISVANENFVVNADGTVTNYGLSQVLKVGLVPGGLTDKQIEKRENVIAAVAADNWKTVKNFVHEDRTALPAVDNANTADVDETERKVGVVVYWEPSGSDNNYNLNNGKTLSNAAEGATALGIDLGIKVIATQAAYEEDSFGSNYDAQATDDVFPKLLVSENVKATVEVDANNLVTTEVEIVGAQVKATVPAGVKVTGTELTMTVTELDATNENIALGDNEESRSLDVHIEGIAADNTVPIIIELGPVMPKYLNIGNSKLYHVQNGTPVAMKQEATVDDLDNTNKFYYDPATGNLTIALATFSEVALVADTENAWKGEFDYSWYTNALATADKESEADYIIANADQLAAFGAIVGGMDGQTQDSFKGKTVKLLSDIDLGDAEKNNVENKIFYPIGYYNSTGSYEKVSGDTITSNVSSFEGTFDGNGHTISNFYQNTWEMFGDYNDGYSGTPNHYKDAMGLFGYVKDGTVKNLTVDNFSSDGEFTPTGVIAAYADGDATFENIAITNCNPRVYNTGNGGIIGIAGDTSTANDDHITLTNITVDNSNTISALWGSYDVACGGLVGMYRGNVDGSGNATGDTISFNNCHVAAVMDVYNDVCGNYQYYAYRYAGMMIGSVRHNTTNNEGKTIPNMTGISATDCTVNYGDWNNYYYCEFESNGHPSYSGPDDYKFSRVQHSELNFTDSNGNGFVDADERASVTGCKHDHTDAENNQAIYLPFHQLFTGYGWGVNSIGLKEYSGIVTNLDITEGDQEGSVEKFETKFTGDFLYRVGNQNTVSVGSLFAAKDGATINSSGVVVTIDKVDDNMNVSGAFTASSDDWTKGTIQFSGTGVVKVTIQDYNYCTPTVLYLEVVDAVNATTAASATANNVVLLNDCGFSSLEVSGGYTLYGNGFTMTCGSDSAALDMGYSFVTLNNGTLDNVQIVCPNFDYAVLYKSNMTESGNRSETTDKTRYFNVKSGVMASGNSQILNSRISGARAAVNVTGGNVVIDNSRIELGAVASVLVGSANSLTLRDVTLVQKPAASTYDSSKTLMGFSVLFVCDADGNAAPVTLEGTLVQNAWVDENDKQYVPSAGQSIISTVLEKTEYLHDINGDGTKESLNLGFAYMPESLSSKVNTTTITDNRTNKDSVPYDYAEVSILNGKTCVYSYKNTNGTADSFKTESEYEPNKYSDIITVNYSDIADGLTTSKSFGTDGWVYELNVDLDKLSGYALDFSKLSMSVNGVIVTDFKVNDNAKPTSPVAVTAGGTTYTLTATVNGKEYTANYKVTGTETSKESPSKISGPTAAGFGVAKSYGGDWSGAADVLTGVKIKYWSVAENDYVDFDFSDFTVPGNAGKLNATNNYWEYTHTNNDFTLKVTNTVAIHSGKSVYGMPIRGEDGKLYFTISSTNGYVGTGTTSRAVTMQYEFTDNNGGEKLTFTHTFNISYDKDKQYSYSDLSSSGKLTPLESSSSSGGSCVTPETLVTLADGTQKRIDQVTYDDQLVVWDFVNGEYTVAPASIIENHGYGDYDVIALTFDDGTVLKVVAVHHFFDADLNQWVPISAANAEQFIGHKFIQVDGDTYTTVELVDVAITEEYIEAWSILTADHYNCVMEGMFSITPSISQLVMGYEIDDNMTYDAEQMAQDIETYGLYSYEEFADLMSYEAFEAFNVAKAKIAVGKGLITYDEILWLIETYV